MSRSIQLDSDGNDITCMKEFDMMKMQLSILCSINMCH